MYFLYSLALSVLFLALLPYFAFQALRHGKYAGSLIERLGWLPESIAGDGRETIWIHAVSVGEFVAATPLIQRLKSDFPSNRIVVSTTTLTGQRLARSQSNLFDCAFYFPFDWRFSVRRALARVNPSVVIILETELWPNFLRECRCRGVVTILANGRISPRSFSRYLRVRSFVKRALRDFSLMIMQSEADTERARKLGALPHQIRLCGNLKYDILRDDGSADGAAHQPEISREKKSGSPTATTYAEIDRQFSLSETPHLIVAGSTAPDEEAILLAAFRLVRSLPGLEDTRLVVAPRHPERFNEVASLIERSGFTFARRSQFRKSPNAAQAPRIVLPRDELDTGIAASRTDVILLDSIGELAGVYRFAAVVFVGGSLVPRGGHNIVEPAAFAKPVVVGRYTENFRQIVSDFERANAVVQLTDSGDEALTSLVRELSSLLSDHERARAIGERARGVLVANRGATECTVSEIMRVVRSPSVVSSP